MALSDLAVFSEYAYSAMTEVLAQQVALFNEASNGTIVLSAGADNQGDFSDKIFFAKVSGLVRRRNAYGAGAVSGKVLTQLIDTMVKVAAGTPPVSLDPGQFKWIQMNPEVAGAALGQQLAKDTLADMLNTAVAAGVAAIHNRGATVINDITGATAPADLISFTAMNTAVAKFGDYSAEIKAWVMHSTPLFGLYANALTNTERLFEYGSVGVIADPFGRRFVISDVPALVVAGSPNKYNSLALVPGAVVVEQNNDFTDNLQTTNGDENIARTYQAEWSYNLGLKGYQWDKTNGGKSPTDAALTTGTNWDKIATSDKDTAGVLLITH